MDIARWHCQMCLRDKVYITVTVVNVYIFELAKETYENIDPDLIDKIYSSPEGVDADSLDIKSKLDPNECFILKSVRNSV